MPDHVSFKVPKGRIVGFIGENGAGKSTTINLILDEIKKDNGQIQLFGKENTIFPVKEDVGIVFDECNFHDVFNTSDIEKILSGIYHRKDCNTSRQMIQKGDKPAYFPEISAAVEAPGELRLICAVPRKCMVFPLESADISLLMEKTIFVHNINNVVIRCQQHHHTGSGFRERIYPASGIPYANPKKRRR